ncbi:hypothetical protein AB8Q84_27450, partial [Klebsiella quasivariicola]|uniref:hypothetical protein n=1 Tax=Klebsiella quasivariicola TaxID=2026240 RepID=UPI0038CFB543
MKHQLPGGTFQPISCALCNQSLDHDLYHAWLFHHRVKEGANKQVISSQADSLIKISRIWADFFPA